MPRHLGVIAVRFGRVDVRKPQVRQPERGSRLSGAFKVCDRPLGLVADLRVRSEIKKHRISRTLGQVLVFCDHGFAIAFQPVEFRRAGTLRAKDVLRRFSECSPQNCDFPILPFRRGQSQVVTNFELLLPLFV